VSKVVELSQFMNSLKERAREEEAIWEKSRVVGRMFVAILPPKIKSV